MVDLFVGPNRILFRVHEKLLHDKAPGLAAMFRGSWKEAKMKSAELGDDDPKAFDDYVSWIYLGKLQKEIKECGSIDQETPLIRVIELYGLASKYCSIALMDEIMNAIIAKYDKMRDIPCTLDMHLAYEVTATNSPLRLYMARCMAYASSVDPGNQLDREYRREIASDNPELAMDTFENLVHHVPASSYPLCDYHSHGNNECPGWPYPPLFGNIPNHNQTECVSCLPILAPPLKKDDEDENEDEAAFGTSGHE
jgi:hypothetical protein